MQWAFAGEVTTAIPNPEIERTGAMIIRVDEEIVRSVGLKEIRIDWNCTDFWYGPGDHVIAAIGQGRDLHPPFEGITNDAVAVWVIRDREVVPFSFHAFGGRLPTTEDELRALLSGARLPPTPSASSDVVAPSASVPAVTVAPGATPSPSGTVTGGGPDVVSALLLVAVAAIAGAFVAERWLVKRAK